MCTVGFGICKAETATRCPAVIPICKQSAFCYQPLVLAMSKVQSAWLIKTFMGQYGSPFSATSTWPWCLLLVEHGQLNNAKYQRWVVIGLRNISRPHT